MSSRERCVFVGPVVMVRGGVGGSPIGLQLSLALAGHRQSGVCRYYSGCWRMFKLRGTDLSPTKSCFYSKS